MIRWDNSDYLSHAIDRKAYNKWYYENFRKKNRLKGRTKSSSNTEKRNASSESKTANPMHDMLNAIQKNTKRSFARQYVKGKVFSYITPKRNSSPTLTYGTTKKRRRNWRASVSMHVAYKVADLAWKKNEKKLNRIIDKYADKYI